MEIYGSALKKKERARKVARNKNGRKQHGHIQMKNSQQSNISAEVFFTDHTQKHNGTCPANTTHGTIGLKLIMNTYTC